MKITNEEIKDKFEQEFDKFFMDVLTKHSKEHKNSFLAWLSKPDWMKIGSQDYRLMKILTELFFRQGITFLINKLEGKNDLHKN